MRIVSMVVKLAPIAAFAAVAFTVGKFGVHSLVALASLMSCVYVTMILFVVVVLGGLLRLSGWACGASSLSARELVLVLGTSSSETALPGSLPDGKPGLLKIRGRARRSRGLFLQSRWHFDLSDDGGRLHRQATDTPLTSAPRLPC